jgi:hypothetical protein
MLRTEHAGENVLYPHRMVWPAFWGEMKDDVIEPLHPEEVNDAIRRTLRVRRDMTFKDAMERVRIRSSEEEEVLGEERADVPEEEWTEEEKAKMAALKQEKIDEKMVDALGDLEEIITTEGAEPVYVANGKAYRIGEDETLEVFDNPAAEPYAWKLAHDVRPARWSSGATGCYECHSADAPIFDGQVTAVGPAIDPEPKTFTQAELAGYDPVQIEAWNQSFQGRTAFKWFGFISAGIVAVILLSFLFLGVNGLLGLFRRS